LKYKPGDIFKIPIGDHFYFLQYLMDDKTLFSANVVRVFNFRIKCDESITLDMITINSIKFVAHTFIKGGIKLCDWIFIGNGGLEGDFQIPIFRATDDVYSEVKKSKKWFIWTADQKEVWIGKLRKKYHEYPYGSVFHPIDLNNWIINGDSGFLFPE